MLTDLSITAIHVYITVCISIVGARLPVGSTSAVTIAVSVPSKALLGTIAEFLAGKSFPYEAVMAMDSGVLIIVHVAELSVSCKDEARRTYHMTQR